MSRPSVAYTPASFFFGNNNNGSDGCGASSARAFRDAVRNEKISFQRSMCLARIQQRQSYEITRAGCTLSVVMVCFLFFGMALLIPFLGALGGRTVVQSYPSAIPYATLQYRIPQVPGSIIGGSENAAAGLSGMIGFNNAAVLSPGGVENIGGGGGVFTSPPPPTAAAAAASTVLPTVAATPVDILLRPPSSTIEQGAATTTPPYPNTNAVRMSNDVSDAAITCGWWPQKCSRSWAVVPPEHPEWLPLGATLNTKFSQCAATCARERSRCECTRAPLIL